MYWRCYYHGMITEDSSSSSGVDQPELRATEAELEKRCLTTGGAQRIMCGSQTMEQEVVMLVWRDCSVVKSTNCSSKGPEFKSQQPHGGSQPSVTRSDALF